MSRHCSVRVLSIVHSAGVAVEMKWKKKLKEIPKWNENHTEIETSTFFQCTRRKKTSNNSSIAQPPTTSQSNCFGLDQPSIEKASATKSSKIGKLVFLLCHASYICCSARYFFLVLMIITVICHRSVCVFRVPPFAFIWYELCMANVSPVKTLDVIACDRIKHNKREKHFDFKEMRWRERGWGCGCGCGSEFKYPWNGCLQWNNLTK